MAPGHKTDALEMMAIHRYYYQGTKYDMTKVCEICHDMMHRNKINVTLSVSFFTSNHTSKSKIVRVTYLKLSCAHTTETLPKFFQGVAAGPWGNPDRWSNNEKSKVTGNWERSIGLFRTSETHVVQARSWLPNLSGGTC